MQVAAPVDSGFLHEKDPSVPCSEALVSFRDIIPSPDHPRIAGIKDHTAQSWCQTRRDVPAPAWLINRLDKKNIETPYKGFSSDGNPDASVYHYDEDEGAPIVEACQAASNLLDSLSESQHSLAVRGDIRTDDEFRMWSNPELYVNEGGLRLDECNEKIQQLSLELLKSSLSTKGYEKVVGCTLTNHFLGELVNGPKVLNRYSYNLRLFLPQDGKPSQNLPWGYTFFGHHLCIAVAFFGKAMVIGPTFMGAEPDEIDVGPHKGLRLFRDEELQALHLIRELSPENQRKAILCEGMTPQDGLAADRWNPFDERHLGGAQQDNRVIPYGEYKARKIGNEYREILNTVTLEGCPISAFSFAQRELIYKIVQTFNIYLPVGPLEHRMQQIRAHEDQTYFAWIGKTGLGDPYYYRIHSPVTFCEFDFHCGIFLTNTSPAKCHIHTINRLPNCGDYGKALFRSCIV